MLHTWIDQWRALPLPLGILVAWLIQVAMYVGAAGEISTVYGIARRHLGIGSLIDTNPLPPHQLRDEIVRSLGACLIYAVPTLAFLHYSSIAPSSIWPESLLQAAWQVVGFLLLNDFCAYWTHRLLHRRGFSKYHSAHHRSKRVTPWSALSMHPAEALLAQVPYCIFLGALWFADLPMGIGTLIGLQLVLMIGQTNSHSNYDPLAGLQGWALLKRQTLFHQRHHQFGRDNYGYMGPHWDRVFNTDHRP
jgi:sterol desaturase/sphingolipid hydroxylase (fatty acid hydroxylase superfamily)